MQIAFAASALDVAAPVDAPEETEAVAAMAVDAFDDALV